jgi:hypothetical protein
VTGQFDKVTEAGDLVSLTAKNTFTNLPGNTPSHFFLRVVGWLYSKNSKWSNVTEFDRVHTEIL